jgi:hypothetical protein
MSLSTSPKEEPGSVGQAVTCPIPTAPDTTVLLDLPKASRRLAITPKQLQRLARIRDIGHVELDGRLYFRPEALVEWAQRNERKVW